MLLYIKQQLAKGAKEDEKNEYRAIKSVTSVGTGGYVRSTRGGGTYPQLEQLRSEAAKQKTTPRCKEAKSKNLFETVFSPFTSHFLRKRTAFTLAEVLITLGIIGVVAALTMPALIQNHRKQVVETSLRKFYSIVNQAVQMSELENGPSQNWEGCIGYYDYMSCAEWYNKYLKKYLKTVRQEIVSIKNLPESNKVLAVYFADGSLMLLLPGASPDVFFFPLAKDFNPETFLETNDNLNSSPDAGRKFFEFEFSIAKKSEIIKYICNDNGRCHYDTLRLRTAPKRFRPFLFCVPSFDENRNEIDTCPTTQEELMSNSFGSAFGCNINSRGKSHCAALIQMNGWKIPKNYPFKF